tara:strand:+ start:129149 stop:130243 length:1095 start_codon:yes stop_codon:yes gene_type:complete
MKKKDSDYMKLALDEALKGQGYVSPNPLVGALLLKNEKIIGLGFHEKYGSHHAEVNAINNASESVEGATLFCTLEPCCHTNKQTPPCVDLIIEKNISKVVIASKDRNPEVNGKGIEKLRNHGIEVVENILENECDEINKEFFYAIENKTPYIHLKFASTLNGKIATTSNDSKWISSEVARKEVHSLRNKYDAILVGGETLSHDNPTLNIRMNIEIKGNQPKIVIIGSINRLKSDLKILEGNREIIWFSKEKNETIPDEFSDKNITLLAGISDLNSILETLYNEFKVTSLLVEGGSQVITQVIDENAYQKVTMYISPKFISGGKDFYSPNKETNTMNKAIIFEGKKTWRMLEDQAVLEVEKCLQD